MASRIEVAYKTPDTRAAVRMAALRRAGFDALSSVALTDIYTIDAAMPQDKLDLVARMFADPIVQHYTLDSTFFPGEFAYAVEIGFLPGVTDNIGATAQESIEDLLNTRFGPDEKVYSSQLTFLSGNLTPNDAQRIAAQLSNPLINRVHIKDCRTYMRDAGMGVVVPKVNIVAPPAVSVIEVIAASDDELARIGKKGIANPDGTRRGPLALDLTYMKAIQGYFARIGRNPTDVELESVAQTWSEHCKHTIFNDPIDDTPFGLFKTYIKAATEQIRSQKGDNDFCVSVFEDNAGAIRFTDGFLICDKVETHNTPSALDPFGGSITGIVGVDRDSIGFGLGAKPFLHRYGFCVGKPLDAQALYRDAALSQKMLLPGRVLEGIVHGVNTGGNCSGIPTPLGFVYADDRYKGKPLVFVGTLGLIPVATAGRRSHEKRASPDDYIVVVGGKVGKDGIHGATFSSEALDSGSPATAVQIGDPITQKKLSDAIVKEARDMGLYTSITDNGAGGLSCSVAEMAKESGGCHVDLSKVPQKYAGLQPWEIWISESQERMTLSVPKGNYPLFVELMARRGVESTVIGEFTNSGRCVVEYDGREVMDVDMGFLHNGLPPRPLHTTPVHKRHKEPHIPLPVDLTQSLHQMLSRHNIGSFDFISTQYDHEVQGGSVIKPHQGRGRVNGDATVVRPLLDSQRGVVISHGMNPGYSDIDTYHMAACAIDTAIRSAIAVGANLDYLALLDNFCWCSSDDPERLYELKRAAQACYDYALAFSTPFISGKDSMFNDFKGFDADGKPIKISVPPTLLISSLGVIEDCTKAVSMDSKIPGDLVYVLGETRQELGASEYYLKHAEECQDTDCMGNKVPTVHAARNKRLYQAVSDCVEKGIIASCTSVNRGGLGVALAKTAMAGMLGMELSLEMIPGSIIRPDYMLFSESQGRFVVTLNPAYESQFLSIIGGNSRSLIGTVRKDMKFEINHDGIPVITTCIETLLQSYRSPWEGF